MTKNDHVLGKAACVAHSWLTSWGLSVDYTKKSLDDPELQVNGVKVSFNGSGQLNLDPFKVASIVLDEVLGELHKVSEHFGLGAPGPARPQEGNARASTKDFEDVVMRVTQFKRTCNPPAADMAFMRPTIKREAQRAFRRHVAVFQSMSYDWEDVFQIATVLAVNHWNQYMTQKWDPDTNGKFLTMYLKQQLDRLATKTFVKARNISMSGVGVAPGMISGSPVPGALVDQGVDGATYTVSYIQEEPVVDVPRKLAAAALEAGLGSLPHDSLVSRLKHAATSEHFDEEVRNLAQRKLDDHVAGCPKCGNSETGGSGPAVEQSP